MLISGSIFGLTDSGVFKTDNSIGTMQNININNAVYDEVHLQSITSGTFTTSLDSWTSSTVLLAKFKDDLAAGNVDMNGMLIDTILIKKRKVDDLAWTTVAEITFDSDTYNYTYIDKLVESSETYEYAIIPASSGTEGDLSTGEIDVLFEGAFLLNKDYNYQLFYNFELGDVNLNIPNSTVELLGSKYPIILYSATTNYKSGSVKCMLVSSSISTLSGNIDVNAEKIYRKNLMDFLTDKKPKILKDMGGLFSLISITSIPKLTPNNDLNAFIYDLSFDFVECGSTDYNSLIAAGILE